MSGKYGLVGFGIQEGALLPKASLNFGLLLPARSKCV